ncbi:AAA family ATPase [Lacipirellula parvula]|uniref:Ribosylnicotinamide kinase n=1 Tax=Lacipirellula parvula TaxID=2650471 RepID=A0A5K7XQ21_9BACT|nr:AAA family ATPase [Lacipirellula parvula]BBO35609.1 ribosylnicotinamide kinase [Lacipirellula parvula]
MTLGFIVGKFYPPHRGHKHLIEAARRQVDQLIVMVAAHPSQTIPGELRKAWLEEIHPDCDIRLVPDELDDDSQQWADFTIRYLGRAPDVVFTSEDYGPVYAGLMGSRHVMIDRERTAFPISATAVRSDPLKHWDMLEPCVRAHFVRRVVLIGAESTGKTTLAQQLAERFDTIWVPEYGREHWERKLAGRTLDDPPPSWSHDEFVDIAQEQQRRENLAARSANRILVCDTNAFATGTWHERYYHARDARVDAIGAADRVDLYLLTPPDVPFVQDGFRDGEHIRHWMHTRFAEQLGSQGVAWALVHGPYNRRFELAEEIIRERYGNSLGV